MKVTIEILAGPYKSIPTKEFMDRNISSQQRAIDGKLLVGDFVTLMDTKSILEAIRKQLSSEE